MSMIYQSQTMKSLLERARRFARSSAPVLVMGESGTGKELLAREIHMASLRQHLPYLQLNCAALSDQLIESELFGHEAGAFTGATSQRIGRLEAAKGGTLLLDEIGELPLSAQAKLLRVLEEQQVQRVGSNQTLAVNTRIVAATNRQLAVESKAGKFRDDLWHRLNILCLTIPPLRERKEDIPTLVLHFLKRYQAEGEHRVERVSAEVMKKLCHFDWPGNVRQLRNTILRSCVLAETTEIQEIELPTEDEVEIADAELPESFLDLPLEEIERRVILTRIMHFGGNKSAAAETLGVTSRTLRNKIERYRELGLIKT